MSIKSVFLEAPDNQLDAAIKPLIRKWDDPKPKAIQILEVLDAVIHGGAGTAFVVNALETFLYGTIADEKTTYEAVVAQATWRNK